MPRPWARSATAPPGVHEFLFVFSVGPGEGLEGCPTVPRLFFADSSFTVCYPLLFPLASLWRRTRAGGERVSGAGRGARGGGGGREGAEEDWGSLSGPALRPPISTNVPRTTS